MQENLPEFAQDEIEQPRATLGGTLTGWLGRLFSKRRLPFWAIVVVCAICNVLLPRLFWTHTELLMAMTLAGGLTTQLAVIATYAALYVNGHWESKFDSILLTFAVWASYVLGLQLAGPMPIEAALFLLGVALIGVLWHFAILMAIKKFTGLCIAHRDDDLEHRSMRRLGIGALMIATTVVAVCYCMVRYLLPDTAQGWPSHMFDMVVGVISLSLISSIISLQSLLLLLAVRLSPLGLFVFVFTLPAWSGVFILTMGTFAKWVDRIDYPTGFLAGHALFSLIGFGAVRFLGYRRATLRVAQEELSLDPLRE